MRNLVAFLLLSLIAWPQLLEARSEAEYIIEAKALADSGRLSEALSLLKSGLDEHPASSSIYAYLGLYTGMSAGQAKDYSEAGRLSGESFALLDKAVELGPENPTAYLYRGIMGVRVPLFLGRLQGAISDLKYVVSLSEKSKGAVPVQMLVAAYSNLGEAYEKANKPALARSSYENVLKLAPGTDAARTAEARIAALAPAAPEWKALSSLEPKAEDTVEISALKKRIETEPAMASLYIELGRALVKAGRFEEAREVLYRHNEIDPSNTEAYRLLAISVNSMAGKGYDERIASDTNLRTALAFEAMNLMDKAVQLDPKNIELRLQRGMMGIFMPFFVNKHEQGVTDLEYVLENTRSPDEKAQALYGLGVARQREAMRYWREVAMKYPESEAAKMALDAMKPSYPRMDPSQHEKPVVSIDFVLGFQDELPPQVAVWIENSSGEHVKTVFVSGFAGNVKGRQVTLPIWAAKSNFDGADAVTGASIDVGHHVYVWDCKGLDGKPVKPGRYTVKVEVSHWPSMRYELEEASFTMGKKEEIVRTEKGTYIPSITVIYFPQ